MINARLNNQNLSTLIENAILKQQLNKTEKTDSIENNTESKLVAIKQAIDNYNNGKGDVSALKTALDAAGIKYEEKGGKLTFRFENKKYTFKLTLRDCVKSIATKLAENVKQKEPEKAIQTLDKDLLVDGLIHYGTNTTVGNDQKITIGQDGNIARWDSFDLAITLADLLGKIKENYSSIDNDKLQTAFKNAKNTTLTQWKGQVITMKDFVDKFIENLNNELQSTTSSTKTETEPKTESEPAKKWEGNVDKKLKELEAQLKKIETKIKNNGGKVSAEMQKELNEIKTLISQIKNEDSKNIDMGKLNLDLNSIPGYSTNTKNIIKKDVNAGKAEAQSILNGLKDKMKAQLKEQAESLGIPESDFQTMFDRVFTVASNYAIRNEVDVRDVAGKLLDKVTYKVANLVNGFLNKFSSVFKDQVESWKDKNPNESVQNKFEELENKLGAVNKEVTSDVNSKVSINKDNLGLNNILGYSTNTKNKISGKKLNNGETIYNEAKSVLNQTKEALYKQMSSQANALGIPDADFEKIFNNAFSTSVARAVDKHVNVLNLPGKIADTGSYKVKNLVDGFLEIFNTKINKDIVKYQLEH